MVKGFPIMEKKKSRSNEDVKISYSNIEFYNKLGIAESTFKKRFQEFIDYYFKGKLGKADFKKDFEGAETYEYNWDCMWSELAGLLISTIDMNPLYDNRENMSIKSTYDVLEYLKLLTNKIEELPEHIKRWAKSSDSYITAVSAKDHIPMIKDKIYELLLVIFLCSRIDGGDIFKNVLGQMDNLILHYCKYYNFMLEKGKDDGQEQKDYLVLDMQKSSLDFHLAEVLRHLMKNESALSFECALEATNAKNEKEQRKKYYSLVDKRIGIPTNYEKMGMEKLKRYTKYKSPMERNEELLNKFKAASYEEKVKMFENDRKNSIEVYKNKIKEYQREIKRLSNLKYSEENMALESPEMYSDFINQIDILKKNPQYMAIKNYIDLLLGQAMIAFMQKGTK
jgi:hypothetical protein